MGKYIRQLLREHCQIHTKKYWKNSKVRILVMNHYKIQTFPMLSFSFAISPFCNKIYIYVFPIATSHFRICVVVLLYFGDDHTFEFLENFLSLLLFPTPCMLFIYTISFEMSLAVSSLRSLFSKMSRKCPHSFFSSGFYFFFLCFFGYISLWKSILSPIFYPLYYRPEERFSRKIFSLPWGSTS